MTTTPRTLLAVHAHADDETITMGGTLARCSAEGVRSVVVTCTYGDLGEVLDPSLLGQDVGRMRQRELEAACNVLGVGRLVQLGYGDSGMPGSAENHRPGAFWVADVDEAAERLLDVITEERPQTIVTYDETGGYGHPDHIKAHQVTLAALRRLPPDLGRVTLWFVRFPLSWSRAFVAALRAEGIDAPGSAPAGADAGAEVEEIGVADDLVTRAVDVRAYVATKRAALACYASQLPSDHFLSRMSSALAAQLWAYEFYSRDSREQEARSGVATRVSLQADCAQRRTPTADAPAVAARLARGQLELGLLG
jgi:LmbE family N-acetylglucosaminyl deacetylase